VGTARRAGFTLVEMLVAVGLVVLMMSLFATVFQIATQAMSKQKGLAENDQKARTLAILLKADLDKRTFRRVVALGDAVPGTAVTNEPEDPATQQGYFCYSENDPYDDTDDVLQFTINVSLTKKNKDTTPLYGRATVLMMPQAPPPATQLTPQQWLSAHPNQPEADDGQVTLDNAGSSDTAEVMYFLRNGILYRRVMLVRKPVDTTDPPDPTTNTNVSYLGAPTFYTYVSATNTVAPSPYSFVSSSTGGFLADFDFSAYNDGTGVHFHGTTQSLNALDNSTTSSNSGLSAFLTGIYPTAISLPTRIAIPNLRFGYSIRTGRPREYATSSLLPNGSKFLGRFTHEETSSPTFTYPGAAPTTTNDPWYIAADLGVDGIATALSGGPRRGEDILLTNVLSFDVKIFDDMYEFDRNGNGTVDPSEDYNGNGVFDQVQDFRDLGYAASPASGKRGYYWHGANANPHYGPKVTNSIGTLGELVYTAASPDFGPDGAPGVQGVDDDGDGTVDNASERGWPGSDDPWNRIFDTWHSSLTNYLGPPPFRPIDNGADGQPGAAGADDDNDMSTDEADERGYRNTDDRHPVRAIQIKIRYLDVASGQIRQMTIVHSLIDPGDAN
jgi:type II secretory pathway pseudopilin PulG